MFTTESEDYGIMFDGRQKLENITKQLKIESSKGESCLAKYKKMKGKLLFCSHGNCSKEQLIVENDVETPIKRK